MKKLVYLTLLVAFGFVFAGCNKDANTAAQDAAKQEGATTNAPAAPKP